MRVYQAELKRIVKTRSVQILFLAAILVSALLAYFPQSFVDYVYENREGEEIKVSGRKAIEMIQKNQGDFQGAITEEKLGEEVEQNQDFASSYEGGLPDGIYDERVQAVDYYKYVSGINGFLSRIREVYADPDTGIGPDLNELTVADAKGFYEQCRRHVRELLYLENGHTARGDSAVALAERFYDHVKMPFVYYPGIRPDALEYVGICTFLLVVIGTILMAPVFASDRQTQADQILRCTRYGKRRLAWGRILAGLTVVTVMYVAGISLFLLLVNLPFGFQSLKTSLQILWTAIAFLPLNIGQAELLIAAAGYVTLLSTVCFTLFLSGRMKSVFASGVTAFLFLLIPILLYMMLDGNLGNWICSILPSGGVGLSNSFTYAIIDTNFAFAGNQAIWTPFLMMGAAAAEIVIFSILTVAGWSKERL